MAQPPDRDERAALADLDRALRGDADPDELRRLAEWDRQLDPDPLSRALPADPIRVSDEPLDPLHHDPARQHAQALVQGQLDQNAHLEHLFHLSPQQWSDARPAPQGPATKPTPASGRALDLPLGQVPSRPFSPPTPPPPSTSTHAARCASCGKPILPALSFCVHCGGPLRQVTEPRDLLLELHAFQDEDARRRLQAWLLDAAPDRPLAARALQQAPARFLLRVDEARADDLSAIFSELGVSASLSSLPEISSTSWFSEGLSALWASPTARVWTVLAACGALALVSLHSACWLAPAFMALAVAAGLAAQRAQRHPRLEPARLLPHLSGLSHTHAARAQRLLQALRDPSARASLTGTLSNHHALTSLSRSTSARWGSAFVDPSEALNRALQQYLDTCERFVEVEGYLDTPSPADLDAQLDAARLASNGRAVAQLSEQRKVVADLASARDSLHAQLLQMSSTVEHLRARLLALSVRSPAPGASSVHPDAAMENLQQDLQVLEEVVHEVQRA